MFLIHKTFFNLDDVLQKWLVPATDAADTAVVRMCALGSFLKLAAKPYGVAVCTHTQRLAVQCVHAYSSISARQWLPICHPRARMRRRWDLQRL